MKRSLQRPIYLFGVAFISALICVPSHAMVVWPPASDVTDTNIDIVKDVRMAPGMTTILATNSDPFQLVVSLEDDIEIRGNECQDSTLELLTQAGEGGPSSITFDISAHDLEFEGQKKQTFLVESNGSGGSVTFHIANDHTLEFDPAD